MGPIYRPWPKLAKLLNLLEWPLHSLPGNPYTGRGWPRLRLRLRPRLRLRLRLLLLRLLLLLLVLLLIMVITVGIAKCTKVPNFLTAALGGHARTQLA